MPGFECRSRWQPLPWAERAIARQSCLDPTSAHGTKPGLGARMAAFDRRAVGTRENGDIVSG